MARIPAAAVFTGSTFQEFREFAAFVCVGFALCSGLQAASPPLYSIGDPSDHEQELLELINRARANPAAEGARLASTADPDVLSAFQSFSVDPALMRSEFETLPVRPPLAFNAALHDAAKAHSQDMFDNAFQGHTGSTGSTMVSRAYAAGYSFSSLAENVYSYGKSVWHGHAGFQVDWGYGPGGMQTGRGHRINIHGNYREIGIGVIKGYHSSSGNSVGPLVITQNFGSRSNSSAFITGVAYYDINGNGLYDAGEGIGGLDVRVSGASYAAVTSTSGGYTVPVPATTATRLVTFSGSGLNFTTSVSTAGGANAKADFIPAYMPPVITPPATIHAGESNRVTFTGIGGVIGYDWRYAALSAFTSDSAENLNQVTPLVTGSYTPLSTSVKQQGAAAYHLAHATPADQILLYQSEFLAKPDATMQFSSRLRYATSSQMAQVEVSTDGGNTWSAVYSQPGSGGSGEAAFSTRSISLGGYAGKVIKLRLRYTYLMGGSLFQGTDNDSGWFVDNLTFIGLSRLGQANVTHGGLDTFFDFTPPNSGRYMLAVRGRLPGRSLPYGQELEIEAFSTTPPPTQPEIAVELIPGGSLNSNGPAVDFGSHETGSTSAAKTFTIRNTGTADLTGIFISKTGSNPGDFIIQGPSASTLAPGGNTTFTVVFQATAAGARSAALQIANNDADENPFIIALAGSGTPPPPPIQPEIAVELAPDGNLNSNGPAVDFGSHEIGSTSAAKTFTIRNTGTADLIGIFISKTGSNPGDFIIQGPSASTLAPGGNTTFTVVFKPTAAGSRSATLQIGSNDADENPFNIAVSGSGTIPLAPAITVEQPAGTGLTSSSISAFGDSNVGAASQAKTFTIRNTGNATLSSIAVSKTGAHVGDFTVNTGSMASSLAPGASTTFAVTFSPTSAGARSASIQIASNDADENPFIILLTGTGVAVDLFTRTIVGTPFAPRVGNQLTLDLTRLADPGQTVKLVGKLPKGLKFNAATGIVTGTITGIPGTYQLTVQILQGRTVVDSVPFPIIILPYPPGLLGNFDGLLEDSQGKPIGVVRLIITKPGAWSASLETVGASRRSAKGTFALGEGTPTATVTANFPAATGVPAVSVSLNLDGNSPNFTGSHNRGSVRGFRIASGSEMPSAIRTYSLTLDPGNADGFQAPAGFGWLTGNWSTKGTGTFKGLLGDATAVSLSLRVSPHGQAVLWAQPYNNRNSYLGGIVTQDDLGQSTNSQARLSDSLWWAKSADSRTLSYPAGFAAMPLTLGSSRWIAPASATSLGASLGWRENRRASVIITGGGLDNADPQSTSLALPTEFSLDDKFSLLASAPSATPRVAWKGKVNKANGSFSGTLTLPPGPAAVSGVLLQDASWDTITGRGLIKVPATGPKGSFRTAAIEFGQ